MKKVTLLDFVKGSGQPPQRPAPAGVDPLDLADELHRELCRRNKMKKGELMELAKRRGASVRDVLTALEMLLMEGRLRKRLDDNGELVYAAERC
jgi:hypothetical protein